jgi:ribokinase
MKVLNFGSLNIDYVYTVDHIVEGGETILSSKSETFSGGKGLNQSIALARAGIPVYHAGLIGEEGDFLLDICRQYGVDTSYIKKLPAKGGHAIIQTDKNGQNCIILYGGTNQMQTREYIDEVLGQFEEGDYIVLQNEINLLDYVIEKAYERGMKIVLNPSPFDSKLDACDLTKIDWFILNEIEGGQFTGRTEADEILTCLAERFPRAKFVLTLGENGSVFFDGKQKVCQEIYKVDVVDTTAAGDTFTGFFLASVIAGKSMQDALRLAAKASSIAVSRAGAAPSIPAMEEVKDDTESVAC